MIQDGNMQCIFAKTKKSLAFGIFQMGDSAIIMASGSRMPYTG